MIDYWKLTKDFKVGDTVQRYAPGQGGYSISPFVGRVTCPHPGLGVVDVQWPYGNERMFPDDILRVDSKMTTWLPPTLDQTYMSWDVVKDRQAASHTALWRTTELPAGFHRELAAQWSTGAHEVEAYDNLWRKYIAQGIDDAAFRDEVSKFYLVAKNLGELHVQQHTAKVGAYWAAQNRKYRATSKEIDSGAPACPKCGKGMRRTTYKMQEGSRMRLFACPKDLFLIKVEDMLGPTGEPHTW